MITKYGRALIVFVATNVAALSIATVEEDKRYYSLQVLTYRFDAAKLQLGATMGHASKYILACSRRQQARRHGGNHVSLVFYCC